MSDAESKFINNANISMLAGAKRSVEQVGQAYGIADTQALEFYEAVYNGKYKIKEGQTNLQAYQTELKKTEFSFKTIGTAAKGFFKNLGGKLVSGLINAGIGMADIL